MYLKPYFKKYRFHYLLGLIAIVIVDLVQLRIPQIIGEATDGLDQKTMTKSGLLEMMLSLLVVGIIIASLRFVWRNMIFGTSRKIETGLRNDFFAHLETLSTHFFNKQKTGDLMAYATNDLNAIRMLVGPGVLMVLDTVVITTLVITRMIGTTDLSLTLFAVVPMPIIAISSLKLGNLIRTRFDKKQEAFAHMSDIVQENISGIRVVKAFVQEAYEIVAFEKVNQDNYEKNMDVVKLHAIMIPLAMLITGVSITITLGYGGRLTMLGVITLGDFIAFIQYIMMLIWPMIALGWFINLYSQGMASLTRFEEILNIKSEIHDGQNMNMVKVQGDIRCVNLSFSYQEENKEENQEVLKNISLNIQKGEHIGIVGRTGCGKTTLVNLMLRLFDAPKESLFIDGESIRNWPLKNLRQGIGYVPQDNFLFSDTIENNIGFGLDSFIEEMILDTAKNVDVHDNIIDFEEGYKTLIGERGVTLSGGQKQRISIARALIKDPGILILDDALSAVDTKTEERILNHLKEVRRGKTTITVAHRISTIQDSDYIYVMEQGEIIEEGTHVSLVEQNGLYNSMVMKQQLEKSIAEEE